MQNKVSASIPHHNREGAINGLHILANLHSTQHELLSDFNFFKTFIEAQIEKFQLTKLGEVYHNFFNGGFTAVICLTESHLSIHTWPEVNYITFDIFLSNFIHDNRETTEEVYRNTIDFFGAEVIQENFISR